MDTISKGEMRRGDVEEWQNIPNDEFNGIDYADGVLNGRHFSPENVTHRMLQEISKRQCQNFE